MSTALRLLRDKAGKNSGSQIPGIRGTIAPNNAAANPPETQETALIPTQSGERDKPKFGTLKGKVIEIDPDWWKPMSNEEVDDFLGAN